MTRLAVLVSGRGSNLDAILHAIAAGTLACDPVLVLSNRPQAGGLAVAGGRGVPTCVLDHRRWPDRRAYDAAVVEALRERGVELVALAGFDRLVTATLLGAFPHRVLNIHPALLPAFKGLHAVRQALEYGARITGATVHLVDEAMDHGPILLQGAVAIAPDDTEASLAARVLEIEHVIYPAALQLVAAGRVRVDGRRVVVSGPPPRLPDAMVWLP